MRLRIRSVKNISQVTRALQAVSASKVRKAMAALMATRPYAAKAWQVLTHIARQPGRETLHPLLTARSEVRRTLVVVITSDRGLAGAYNTNLIRFVLRTFGDWKNPVCFLTIGRKGRDLLLRRRLNVTADFSGLPAAPSFVDVSAIGRMVVQEFLEGRADEVYLAYTDFINMLRQEPVIKKLLRAGSGNRHRAGWKTSSRSRPFRQPTPTNRRSAKFWMKSSRASLRSRSIRPFSSRWLRNTPRACPPCVTPPITPSN